MNILPSFLGWFHDHSDSIEAFALDIDGVLVNGRKPLPGAVELVEMLRSRKLPFVLLTNDGSNSPEQKCLSVGRSGLVFQPDEIVSASHPLKDIAAEKALVGKNVFVMGSLGNPCFAEAAGMVSVKDLDKLPECAAILIGEREFDWEKSLNAAINYFAANPHNPLIVPNPDVCFLNSKGHLTLASGAPAKVIQDTLKHCGISVKPIFLGKPYDKIFQYGHAVLEKQAGKMLDRKRIMMIGDSLAGDIAGANDFGYRSSLVLTGLTNERILAGSNVTPDLIFRGL